MMTRQRASMLICSPRLSWLVSLVLQLKLSRIKGRGVELSDNFICNNSLHGQRQQTCDYQRLGTKNSSHLFAQASELHLAGQRENLG